MDRGWTLRPPPTSTHEAHPKRPLWTGWSGLGGESRKRKQQPQSEHSPLHPPNSSNARSNLGWTGSKPLGSAKQAVSLRGLPPAHTHTQAPAPHQVASILQKVTSFNSNPDSRDSDTNQDGSVHNVPPHPSGPGPILPAGSQPHCCLQADSRRILLLAEQALRAGLEAALARRSALDLVFSWVVSVPFTHTALGRTRFCVLRPASSSRT